MMLRRIFVHGLALGLLVVPVAAEAQPAGKVYRIRVLSTANRPQGPAMEAFRSPAGPWLCRGAELHHRVPGSRRHP